MISDEKHFDYIGAIITDRIDRSRDALKLFLQLFSAIVGGSIWLSIQPNISEAARKAYERASNGLVVLLVVVTVATICRAAIGWWKYREKLSTFDLGNDHVPPPTYGAIFAEGLMVICVVIAGCFYISFNPFAIQPN